MTIRVLVTVALVTLVLASGPAAAAPRYSPWSTPAYLGAVNTAALEFANAISKDGLSFYFQRGDATSPDPAAREDIWVVQRPSRDEDWGEPQKLSDNVNSSSNDRAAFVSPDGHWLFFASDRPGGRGGLDLMASWRPHVHEDFGDFGWQPAMNLDDLGGPVNTPGFESGPAIFQDDEAGALQLYFVSNPTGGQALADVYLSIQDADGSFGTPAPVTELNSPSSEGRPYLRHDGLEIYFQSNRPGGKGGFDIWVSTRTTTHGPWSTPESVPVVNTAANDLTPVLSWDGLTLVIASNRTGSNGEVFFSTREKVHGKP